MASAVPPPLPTSAISSRPFAGNTAFQNKSKGTDVRLSNMTSAKAISDAIRTSLGPKGMDKMIQTSKGELIITNDGATIMKSLQALHPAAKMLVEMSIAQDVEAGDGTTTVVVLAGSLLSAAERMLVKGLHPSIIADSFMQASAKAVEYLTQISTPVSLDDRAVLIKAAATSLNSKIISTYSNTLAPIAVDAVMRITDTTSSNVDLRDIRIIKRTGGTIEDTALITEGLVLHQNAITSAGGPNRTESAKIGLIQFQLSAPKPDMDNTVVIANYRQMDKVAQEQRKYILSLCSKIKKSGCNVLLIQKSILRDAIDELALHLLARLNILVVKDVEREEVAFLSKTLRCTPVSDIEAFSSEKLGRADIEAFSSEKLGRADIVEEVSQYGAKYVNISGIANMGRTISIVAMGPNSLIVDEVERSLHDALCVMRCLIKKRALIAGGGAPEVDVSRMLSTHGRSLKGAQAYCFQAYADALEVIPITLAENAGLNAISILTELRNRHARGERNAGIDMRKGLVSDVFSEDVVQPLLVSTSAFELATETVCLLLKLDDYVQAR